MCSVQTTEYYSTSKKKREKEMKGNCDTVCDNDDPWIVNINNYVNWNMSVTKGQISHNSTYMNFLEQSNS